MPYGIVAYQEKDHDNLVDIWYEAVVHTHTFLAKMNIQFYHDMVKNGALKISRDLGNRFYYL